VKPEKKKKGCYFKLDHVLFPVGNITVSIVLVCVASIYLWFVTI
jgi:hypothetical protein